MSVRPIVVKLGGELVEPDQAPATARALATAACDVPLVVVHGGGREIDRLLARVDIEKRMVDGVRVTDAPTLEIVTAVLGGVINTRLVAAMAAAGARPVGLTGADAALAPVAPAAPVRAQDRRDVDLGLVGEPEPSRQAPRLLVDLCTLGYVPVIASLGLHGEGVLNVNADTLAASLARRLQAPRLVLAGAAPGVLDETGATIGELDADGIKRLVRNGVASGGMIAKLNACLSALDGVDEVVIADGFEVLEEVITTGTSRAGRATRIAQKGVGARL